MNKGYDLERFQAWRRLRQGLGISIGYLGHQKRLMVFTERKSVAIFSKETPHGRRHFMKRVVPSVCASFRTPEAFGRKASLRSAMGVPHETSLVGDTTRTYF